MSLSFVSAVQCVLLVVLLFLFLILFFSGVHSVFVLVMCLVWMLR